jgi:hypothetical protein
MAKKIIRSRINIRIRNIKAGNSTPEQSKKSSPKKKTLKPIALFGIIAGLNILWPVAVFFLVPLLAKCEGSGCAGVGLGIALLWIYGGITVLAVTTLAAIIFVAARPTTRKKWRYWVAVFSFPIVIISLFLGYQSYMNHKLSNLRALKPDSVEFKCRGLEATMKGLAPSDAKDELSKRIREIVTPRYKATMKRCNSGKATIEEVQETINFVYKTRTDMRENQADLSNESSID